MSTFWRICLNSTMMRIICNRRLWTWKENSQRCKTNSKMSMNPRDSRQWNSWKSPRRSRLTKTFKTHISLSRNSKSKIPNRLLLIAIKNRTIIKVTAEIERKALKKMTISSRCQGKCTDKGIFNLVRPIKTIRVQRSSS